MDFCWDKLNQLDQTEKFWLNLPHIRKFIVTNGIKHHSRHDVAGWPGDADYIILSLYSNTSKQIIEIYFFVSGNPIPVMDKTVFYNFNKRLCPEIHPYYCFLSSVYILQKNCRSCIKWTNNSFTDLLKIHADISLLRDSDNFVVAFSTVNHSHYRWHWLSQDTMEQNLSETTPEYPKDHGHRHRIFEWIIICRIIKRWIEY